MWKMRSYVAWGATLGLVFSTPLLLAAADQGSGTDTTEKKVQQAVDQKLDQHRETMMKEAQAALDETNAALQALTDGKNQDALEALARATGQLELVVARDPELALAPVDVSYITHDLYATPEAIRKARDRAEDLLEDGEVQEARALLSGLASEFVISVTNVPLATYPDAIKAISPLIDEGKTEEAKKALRAVLDTLVVTDEVISLPVLRAEHMLNEAETLVRKDEPSEGGDAKAKTDRRAEVDDLLKGARRQLEISELLGYGEKQDYETFRKQIAELEKKIGTDEETEGVFARLRQSLNDYEKSFFE